jgi:hypothetical protein
MTKAFPLLLNGGVRAISSPLALLSDLSAAAIG